MINNKPKKGKGKTVEPVVSKPAPATLPAHLTALTKNAAHIVDDDDDDDEGEVPSAPPGPVDRYEWSRFQRRYGSAKNLPAKLVPDWCAVVTDTLPERIVLAQISYWYDCDENGICRTRYKCEDGYRWNYKRYKELAKALFMSEHQVRHAVQGMIKKKLLVEGGWKENNRYLRINVATVEELLEERDSSGA